MSSFQTFSRADYQRKYWCETCDRDFNSYNLLENHKRQHQTCNVDGCKFVAHPNIITKHIQMQHSSGIYKKIAKLNDPLEIKKWIEERKNRYPTKSNVEKKLAELKEKICRGEKMGLKRNPKHKWQNSRNEKGNKKQRKIKPQSQNKFKEAQVMPLPNTNSDVPKGLENSGLKPFGGIQMLINDIETEDVIDNNYNIPIEYDDDVCQEQPVAKDNLDNNVKVCNILSSLISNYASSEDELNSHETNRTSVNPDNLAIHNLNDTTNVINDNDDPPEEAKIEKEKIEIELTNNKKVTKYKSTSIRQVRGQQNMKLKLPSTLLEKLLWKEIKQERNQILQCIRFIVKNNFFDTK